ncbi:MAG: diacylglycerol kinase family protein [Chlorobiaceae bacterium]
MSAPRYLFIFNPAADKGRASQKLKWLKTFVFGRSDSSLATTSYAGHAGELAQSAIGQRTTLISCGGDGTLHEIVNAVAGKDVTVGVLPFGSGNDFIKTLNSHSTPRHGIGCLFGSGSRAVDLGCVTFGNDNLQYFINSLGIGFTGRVAKAVKSTPWLKGEFAYVYALFSVLIGYTPPKMHITITCDDCVLQLYEPVFAFSVSNGKIEGGKFRIAPHADLSDGLLDVCILKSVGKYEFFSYVLKYLYGSHIYDPKVLYCKAKAVDIMLEEPDVMHMDGEVYDGVCGSIAISVVPEGIHMLCDVVLDSKP